MKNTWTRLSAFLNLKLKNHDGRLKSTAKFFLYGATIFAVMILSYTHQVVFSGKEAYQQIVEASTTTKHELPDYQPQIYETDPDRINILLLGIGGVEHEGANLTDTIMLLSIRPTTKEVAILSIPRDLLVEIPGYGWRKVNNAYAFGELTEQGYGGLLISQVLSKTLDLPIQYYVRVDFNGFTKIIDDLGGVKIRVEHSFVDTRYPDSNYGVETIAFDEGWQVMDGATALKYSRSRHGNNDEGSDFARARRQQLVMKAVKDKFFSFGTLINPLKVTEVIQTLGEHLQTNIDLKELVKLGRVAAGVNQDEILHFVLEDSPAGLLRSNNYDGAYVLEPRVGDWYEIRAFVHDMFNQERYLAVSLGEEVKKEAAKVEIQNGTFIDGLAVETGAHLMRDGIVITHMLNAARRDYEKTVIYDLSQGQKPWSLKYLKAKLDANVAPNIPNWLSTLISSTQTPNFVVILGNN